jgi:hypothetical protein
MSSPREPGRPRAACHPAPRRRSARQRGTVSRRQPRDVCPARQRLLDPDHEAFVEWFVAYWRRHGGQLFATDQANEKEAPAQNV